jgi:hypothetical protein
MTSQQHADLLLSQWQALWLLPPAERIRRIDEIKQDFEFEEMLQSVRNEMEYA